MLFTNPAYRHNTASRILDRLAEELFSHEDSFGMVAKRAVPKVCHVRLALVEPVVNGQIVGYLAAPLFN